MGRFFQNRDGRGTRAPGLLDPRKRLPLVSHAGIAPNSVRWHHGGGPGRTSVTAKKRACLLEKRSSDLNRDSLGGRLGGGTSPEYLDELEEHAELAFCGARAHPRCDGHGTDTSVMSCLSNGWVEDRWSPGGLRNALVLWARRSNSYLASPMLRRILGLCRAKCGQSMATGFHAGRPVYCSSDVSCLIFRAHYYRCHRERGCNRGGTLFLSFSPASDSRVPRRLMHAIDDLGVASNGYRPFRF